MASFAETGPRRPVVESIRVDKVSPRARLTGGLRVFTVCRWQSCWGRWPAELPVRRLAKLHSRRY